MGDIADEMIDRMSFGGPEDYYYHRGDRANSREEETQSITDEQSKAMKQILKVCARNESQAKTLDNFPTPSPKAREAARARFLGPKKPPETALLYAAEIAVNRLRELPGGHGWEIDLLSNALSAVGGCQTVEIRMVNRYERKTSR